MSEDTIEPHNWNEIIGYYLDVAGEQTPTPLLNFVMEIKKKGLDQKLFAYTDPKDDKLVMSNQKPIEPFRNSLQVTYHSDSDTIEVETYNIAIGARIDTYLNDHVSKRLFDILNYNLDWIS